MKLLYYHRTRCTGADGTHIKGVVKGFQQLGYEVNIFSPAGFDAEFKQSPVKFPVEKKHKNKLLLNLPRPVFESFELLYNIAAFFKLFFYMLRKKYDFIYERYAFLNLAGTAIAGIFKKPLFLEVNFTTKTEVYPKRSGFFSFLEKMFENNAFRRAALIIVISDELKESIACGGIEKGKIIVLPNAVNLEQFKNFEKSKKVMAELNLDEKEKIVGFVGSFYPWHGLDFLLDAFKMVLKDMKNVKLLLLGDGQMAEHLKARVEKEDMNGAVIFTGRVGQDFLQDYMSLFDIGVMPDSNDYGSPMKIFEYMAMKKPIVAPRLAPIVSVLEHGREGLLFEKKNIEEFKAALKKLLDDEVLCKKMGENGREKVARLHTWDKNVKKMISLFEKNKKTES
ncbi:MAG: glycosyltransferase family 4 protein [Candidatus Omnitrophica bacterium]|nr:glycosyltransferase family 4 protein [Candidatus Omnitrophota bacterium]